MIKRNWEADILERTYEDVMDIKRTVNAEDEDTGITESKEITVATRVKCALSKKQLPVLSGETNNITTTHAVYCRPETDVKTGDILTVTRLGNSLYKQDYIVGDIFPYISHLEVAVEKRERV